MTERQPSLFDDASKQDEPTNARVAAFETIAHCAPAGGAHDFW
jgi:hypothetical protein